MVASGRRRVWALGGRWWASGALPSAAWAAFGPVVTLAKAGAQIHYVFVCRYGLPPREALAGKLCVRRRPRHAVLCARAELCGELGGELQ